MAERATIPIPLPNKIPAVSKLRLVLVQGATESVAGVAGEYWYSPEVVNEQFISNWQGKGEFDADLHMLHDTHNGPSWIINTLADQAVSLKYKILLTSESDADVPYEADWGPNYKVSEVYLSKEKKWVAVETLFKSSAVHIWWSAPNSPKLRQEGISWFYNEITVTESIYHTYYMTNGFTGGYMGIQDTSPKQVIFSIWDNVSDSESKDDQTDEFSKGEGVTVKRFSGEGTGGQSFFPYEWSVGKTYQLMVNVRPDKQPSDKVIFTGWFRIPEKKIWRMLASFQVRSRAASKKLESPYSFLEDYQGTGKRRQGLWGPAWFKSDNGSWVQATHGNGTTTGKDSNNRAIFLSEDKKQLGMITGGPALKDTSLGPYDVTKSPIPSVLTLNPLPSGDGSPAIAHDQ